MKPVLAIAFLLSLNMASALPAKDTTSYIQLLTIATGKIDTLLIVKRHFEAPNWHPDGYLLANSYGRLYTINVKSGDLNAFDTGPIVECNNDHGYSPDHQWLAISSNNARVSADKTYKSLIYVVSAKGGTPRQVTPLTPSYWHGWSRDGKTLAYCAERNGNYDIYTIPVEGGQEKRITTEEGLDDGPEYSPDGKYIYFNSYRTGHMQLWRMGTDGSHPEQLTFDENSNWFAHLSPDGKWMAWIAYTSDEKQQHLFGKNVKLRIMDLSNKSIRDLTPVFHGGQGTINVPSWSADSKRLAFVSYSVN